MRHTSNEIEVAFKCNAPDAYLTFFEAVQEILHRDSTCQTHQLQKIGILLAAAESGKRKAGTLCAPLSDESLTGV